MKHPCLWAVETKTTFGWVPLCKDTFDTRREAAVSNKQYKEEYPSMKWRMRKYVRETE